MNNEKDRIDKGLSEGKTFYASGGKKLKSKKQDGTKSAPPAASTSKPDERVDEKSDAKPDEKIGKAKK